MKFNLINNSNISNTSVSKSRLTIFFTEAICMILELCSSYLFYPYFGNTNTIWISIITVILLSNCLGNIIGGHICKKYYAGTEKKNYSGTTFFLIATAIILILTFTDPVIFLVNKIPISNDFKALLSSLLLFLPCNILLGTIPPQVMFKETTEENYNAEKTGIVYALSTMGGLFGSVIGGFFLVPYIGCKYIIIICSIIALIFGFFYTPQFWKKTTNIICLLTVAGIIFSTATYKAPDWENEDYSSITIDSQYNRIILQNTIENGEKIRDMIMESGYESATYLDKDKRNELIFEYFQKVNDTILENKDIKSDKMLMIGGAAYQFPKFVISHYSDAYLDVVELDPKVTELAKQYFFLQDCIDEFDPNNERLGLYNDDGREFLKKSSERYDIIFNDAFSGNLPIATLSSVEFAKIVKTRLSPNGLYVVNIIDTREGNPERFLLSEAKTLSTVFKNIHIIECHPDRADNQEQNLILIATDGNYNFDNATNMDFSKGLMLTDDYCPVEHLSK